MAAPLTEDQKAKRRVYYATHRAEIRAKRVAYTATHRETIRAWNRALAPRSRPGWSLRRPRHDDLCC